MYNDPNFDFDGLSDDEQDKTKAYNNTNKLFALLAFLVAVFVIAFMALGFAISFGSSLGLNALNDVLGTEHGQEVVQFIGTKKIKREENKLVIAKNDGSTIAHTN